MASGKIMIIIPSLFFYFGTSFAQIDEPLQSKKNPLITENSKITFSYSGIQNIFTEYAQKYQPLEFFSGGTISIYLPGDTIHNFYAGTVGHSADSQQISDQTLFQIGSITKSFTAAILLQLEKEKKLTLNDTVGDFLPQYSKWSKITIRQLLNMTSGIPNYSETPLFGAAEFNNPEKKWTEAELINFVYPNDNFEPPLKSGYFYSNTGYILAGMIIEKTTQNNLNQEFTNRLFKSANLTNTFYPVPDANQDIQGRLAHGYGYNQYDNPEWVGKDAQNNSLSWAGAAGGLVSNSEDIIKWVQALFTGNEILDASQKQALMQLNSTQTGTLLPETTINNNRAFGLGVAQAFNNEGKLGRYWYYEGETIGFRAIYFYQPCSGIIVSAIFNSATNVENDHLGELMDQVYQTLITQNPKLACKAKVTSVTKPKVTKVQHEAKKKQKTTRVEIIREEPAHPILFRLRHQEE